MAEDASAERVMRVDELAAMGDEETHEEYIYHLNKIIKLYEEKMMLLVPGDVLPKKVVKASHETKKSKRPITTQQKKKKRKPIVRTRMPLVNNHVTEQLKEFIANEMNGEQVKVVIQKKLYESDLKEDQNRLNIPINQLQTHDFLNEQEKRDVENGEGLKVELLGPKLRMHEKPMVLKIWHMKSTNNYVLKKNWNDFVKANEKDLKENTMIQVWSFRRDDRLCFALACLERDVDGQNDAVEAPIV